MKCGSYRGIKLLEHAMKIVDCRSQRNNKSIVRREPDSHGTLEPMSKQKTLDFGKSVRLIASNRLECSVLGAIGNAL